MELPFTNRPGRRERHLRRRHENPLFAWPPIVVKPRELLAAQEADHEEMVAFRDAFRALVQKAVDLPPDAGSDQVLALKEELEEHYEKACGLPEDHTEEKQAIARLIGLIMKAVWRTAGGDPLAQQELQDEEQARAIHFSLLEQPLVADLLHPATPIAPDELTPSLLSATAEEVEAALELFDPDQLAVLIQEGGGLITSRASEGPELTQARLRLNQMELRLRRSLPADRVN